MGEPKKAFLFGGDKKEKEQEKMKVLEIELKFYKRNGYFSHCKRVERYEMEDVEASELLEEESDGETVIKRSVLLALLSIADVSPEEYAQYEYVTLDTQEIKR